MKYGISSISVVPVRKDSSEQSEMLTQLLFGEQYKIILEKEKWCKIETAFDSYVGWIDKKTVTFITEQEYEKNCSAKVVFAGKVINPAVRLSDGSLVYLPFGAVLYDYKPRKATFVLSGDEFELQSDVFKKKSSVRDSVVFAAHSLLNCPYLWGGRNPFGMDCSGFTQLVYKVNDLVLPRDASQQVESGKTLNFLNEAKPGDLAFFDNDEGLIVHVGLLLGQNKIIHASGKVRVDVIDHQGIFNVDLKRYTHKLRVIKSII